MCKIKYNILNYHTLKLLLFGKIEFPSPKAKELNHH